MPRFLSPIVLAFLSLMFIGCGGPSTPEQSSEESENDILQVGKPRDLLNTIEENKGKVVVIDFWATTCPPCIREFPNLLKLQKKFGTDKVRCISASVDPKENQDRVRHFLKRVDADIPNFLLDCQVEDIMPHWTFQVLGTVFVYDQKGRQVLKTRSYEEVFEKVEELLITLPITRPETVWKTIQQNKTKVVVVDFWATWCPACQEEFPKLVELHKKYGSDPVRCISVSLDEKESHKTALEFLREHRAQFPNFLLDVSEEELEKNWKFKTLPWVYVYNQEGQEVLNTDDYAQVFQTVETLLKKTDADEGS